MRQPPTYSELKEYINQTEDALPTISAWELEKMKKSWNNIRRMAEELVQQMEIEIESRKTKHKANQ